MEATTALQASPWHLKRMLSLPQWAPCPRVFPLVSFSGLAARLNFSRCCLPNPCLDALSLQLLLSHCFLVTLLVFLAVICVPSLSHLKHLHLQMTEFPFISHKSAFVCGIKKSIPGLSIKLRAIHPRVLWIWWTGFKYPDLGTLAWAGKIEGLLPFTWLPKRGLGEES